MMEHDIYKFASEGKAAKDRANLAVYTSKRVS